MGKSDFRAIDLVKPFVPIPPEVESSNSRIPFKKVIFTVISLLVFLVCSQLPLYGIHSTTGADPFYWMRAILASYRGTVMELGVDESSEFERRQVTCRSLDSDLRATPVASALKTEATSMFLAGSKLIHVDNNVREDRSLLNGAQKLLSILIAIGQALAYILFGMYGSVNLLGTANAILIIVQLCFASIIMIYLDELLQNGYGLGSGISLFIATSTCENIIWKAFSPTTINSGKGTEFEGALVALMHFLITRADKGRALREAFFRENLPNVASLLATIFISLIVVYYQGFQVQLPVSTRNTRGQQGTYPIKLFYTSNMPVILLSSLQSNLFFISQFLQRSFGAGFLVNLFGKWKESEAGVNSVPVGGVAYYFTAPSSRNEVAADPIHATVYLVFVLSACALFSRTWIEVSGTSAKDVAKQLRDQHMHMRGHRDGSFQRVLNLYIPTAAAFGGVCIGALTVLGDFMGAIGSGTGILLAVTVIYHYFETYDKERTAGL